MLQLQGCTLLPSFGLHSNKPLLSLSVCAGDGHSQQRLWEGREGRAGDAPSPCAVQPANSSLNVFMCSVHGEGGRPQTTRKGIAPKGNQPHLLRKMWAARHWGVGHGSWQIKGRQPTEDAVAWPRALPQACPLTCRRSLLSDLPTPLKGQVQRWETPAPDKSSCYFPSRIYYPINSDLNNSQH